MLIVGARGFAKEVLEILYQRDEIKNLHLYDDMSILKSDKLFDRFIILSNLQDAEYYLKTVDNRFTIGIGNPLHRYNMFEKFTQIGGVYTSTISSFSEIGSFDIRIKDGCNILSGVKVSNSVTIGKGCLIYYNVIITHDVVIGEFVEISPGVTILGRAIIEDFVIIGAGAIIFPDVKIGKWAVIGAGAVVRNNVSEKTIVVGVPAKFVKNNI